MRWLLAAAVVWLNAADLALTQFALSFGLAEEMNSLAEPYVFDWRFAAAKVGGAAAMALTMAILAGRDHPGARFVGRGWLVFVSIGYLMVVSWNIYQLWSLVS